MENNNEISRRSFLEKGKKLAYLTPVILTVFTGSENIMADDNGKGKGKTRRHGHGVSPADPRGGGGTRHPGEGHRSSGHGR